MGELRACEDVWFTAVRTILNSGNVLFSIRSASELALRDRIEESLQKRFAMNVSVILRTLAEIDAPIVLDPFRGVLIDARTRLFVTLFSEPLSERRRAVAPDDLVIFQERGREVFSVLTLRDARSIDARDFIDRADGKAATSRSWKTVCRFVEAKEAAAREKTR